MQATMAQIETTQKKLTAVFIFCFLATFFAGIVSMLMSVYLPVVVKELLGNVSSTKMNNVSALINSVFIFGWMLGGFVWGIICDKIGRKRSVVYSTLCYSAFAVATAYSSSWFLVSVCRFFSGFGIGGLLVAATVFIEELWPEKKKAIMQGMVALAMPVGFFAAGAINNFSEDWRIAFRICIIPLLLAFIAAFILPESGKWKVNKLALQRKQVMSDKLFAAAYRKNLLTGSVIFGAMLIGLWAIFSWAPTWVESIAKSGDVQQLRGLTMMILAGSGIAGSYTLSGALFGNGGAGNMYDAIYDQTGNFKTVPIYGYSTGVEYYFGKKKRLHSNLVLGYTTMTYNASAASLVSSNVIDDNEAGDFVTNSSKSSTRIALPFATINVMFDVTKNFLIGLEYNTGAKQIINSTTQTSAVNRIALGAMIGF